MWTVLPTIALLQSGSSITFGTDPTEPVSRVELAFDHEKARDGDVVDRLTARVDVGFDETVALRVDLPYGNADPHDGGTVDGLGDVRAQVGWRAYSDPEFSIFFGGGVVLDTADEDELGMGQKQVFPMVAASGDLPGIRSKLYETIEHFMSFDTDHDRQGVQLTKLDMHLMTEWSMDVWTQVGGEFFVDWKGGEDTGLNFDVELGRSFGNGLVLWVQPEVGVFGEDVPGVVDWRVEVGVRWNL